MFEEMKEFPLTADDALARHKDKIDGLVFPSAPGKKIKIPEDLTLWECSHFTFVYGREIQQYFLFLDVFSGEDLPEDYDSDYSVMKIYAVVGDELKYIATENIVLNCGVFKSKCDLYSEDWCSFRRTMSFHGNTGTYERFIQTVWKQHREEYDVSPPPSPPPPPPPAATTSRGKLTARKSTGGILGKISREDYNNRNK